jgi:hypothetical protein
VEFQLHARLVRSGDSALVIARLGGEQKGAATSS